MAYAFAIHCVAETGSSLDRAIPLGLEPHINGILAGYQTEATQLGLPVQRPS
jgi:hypothetical protein